MEYSTESYFAGILFPCLTIPLEWIMLIISLIMKVRAPKEELKFQVKIRDEPKVNLWVNALVCKVKPLTSCEMSEWL